MNDRDVDINTNQQKNTYSTGLNKNNPAKYNEDLFAEGENVNCTRLSNGNLECDGEEYEVVSDEEELSSKLMAVYIALCCFFVVFAGLMSGLTLGLLSLDTIHLQILQQSGKPHEKKYAKKILPLLKTRHLVLVTLLICNAAAMEALPIFLDRLVPSPIIAIVVSVTAVLIFGEILPQAVCARFGLAIGANTIWLVQFLMIITFPITYPISKMLDWLLGHNEAQIYRRGELKELVSLHARQSLFRQTSDPISSDEVLIIQGALDLKTKKVSDFMSPIKDIYMLSTDTKITKQLMQELQDKGYSRVPVFENTRQNVVGLLLVKNLITVDQFATKTVGMLALRDFPSIPGDVSLYDILNEFQRGQSHMASVYDPDTNSLIGFITLEDVIEELLQEEISDEKDSGVRGASNQNQKGPVIFGIRRHSQIKPKPVTERSPLVTNSNSEL